MADLDTIRRRQWAVEQVIAAQTAQIAGADGTGKIVLAADQVVECAHILYRYAADGLLPKPAPAFVPADDPDAAANKTTLGVGSSNYRVS